MANRYAPYKSRWLAREPKVVLAKFTTTNAANALLSVASKPFNIGIVNVNTNATGVYAFYLGTSTTAVDPYYKLGGVKCTFDAINCMAYVSNDQSGNTTTPFVEITVCNSSAGSAINVANTKSMWAEFLFIDSTD